MKFIYPSELKTGLFSTMGLRVPPQDTLDLVLSKGDTTTRLWGRLKWDNKDIVFLTGNIMHHQAESYGQILSFVWRARSPDNGIALVNDGSMTGRLCFRIGPDSDGVPERYEINLNGIGHAMDMYLYGRQQKLHEPQEEAKILADVTREWEALANDPKQADLETVKENYGSIDERALSDEILETELYSKQAE